MKYTSSSYYTTVMPHGHERCVDARLNRYYLASISYGMPVHIRLLKRRHKTAYRAFVYAQRFAARCARMAQAMPSVQV